MKKHSEDVKIKMPRANTRDLQLNTLSLISGCVYMRGHGDALKVSLSFVNVSCVLRYKIHL